jgi:signal transduction histidine kinase
MAQEILRREQLKNDFISSVSHELRTPLTSIKGWAVTLKNGFEDRHILLDGLEIIEKESDRLTLMVEELLDFSQFTAGKITLEKKPVDLPAVLEHIRKQLNPRAEREQLEFEVLYQSGLPLLVTDENRLKQVFINLLDNAFKFTPPGGKVSLSVCYEEDTFRFRVRDTGCGIAEEELPQVKEKFFKGKSSKSRNGIGLSICEEIIQLMHGWMDITSRPNQGTEVLVSLPQQECG